MGDILYLPTYNIPLATRPDGGPVWSCGENYHFLAKDWVKGF